jgi:putative transcriptional regulator
LVKVGKFLIARPTIEIGFFTRSVVFVYQSAASGVSGFCLNKHSSFWTRDLALQMGHDYPTGTDPVYLGGPVNERSVNLLHTDDFVSTNTLHTGVGIDVSSDLLMIEKIVTGNRPRYFKFVAGNSVWAPGQLEFEIQKQYWLVADLNLETVFNLDGDKQWESAVDQVSQQLVQKYF